MSVLLARATETVNTRKRSHEDLASTSVACAVFQPPSKRMSLMTLNESRWSESQKTVLEYCGNLLARQRGLASYADRHSESTRIDTKQVLNAVHGEIITFRAAVITVGILHRYLVHAPRDPKMLPVTVAAMWMAAKMEDTDSDLEYASDCILLLRTSELCVTQVVEAERELLKVLQYRIDVPRVDQFLDCFCSLLSGANETLDVTAIEEASHNMHVDLFGNDSLRQFLPSEVAIYILVSVTPPEHLCLIHEVLGAAGIDSRAANNIVEFVEYSI